MTRWTMPILWNAAAVWVLLFAGGRAFGQEPADDIATAVPDAEPARAVYAVPTYSLGFSGVPYTASVRAYRRGTVPAFGVYVGPRSIYAGTLAPWGSISARYYASSYPLPLYALPSGAAAGPAYGRATTPYRPTEYPAGSSASPLDPSSAGPFMPEKAATVAVPEAIPAPQPFDMPSPDTPAAAAPGGSSSPRFRPPASKPASSRRSESGPREF